MQALGMQLPNGLPSDIERLLSGCRNDDDLVSRLKTDDVASQKFLILATQNRDWCERNMLLLGRVIQVAKEAKERMRQLGDQVGRAVDDILTNGVARKQAICESLFMLIAFRRQCYDLDRLYAELAVLPLPMEFKVLALTGPMARIKDAIATNTNQYGDLLSDPSNQFDRINANVIGEAQRFMRESQEKESLIEDLNHHSLLWEKLNRFISQRCVNGDYEFLLRDLQFLGLPESMKELAALLRKNEGMRQNPNHTNLEKFKREFEAHKSTIRDKYPLYTALQKLTDVYKGPQSASAAISAPVSRNDSGSHLEEPANVWRLFVDYVKERQQKRCDDLMRKLAQTTIPMHYKILALCPDFERVIDNATWPDHFNKYWRTLAAHEKQALISLFERQRRSMNGSPTSSHSGSTHRLSMSPPSASALADRLLPFREPSARNGAANTAASAAAAAASSTEQLQGSGSSTDH